MYFCYYTCMPQGSKLYDYSPDGALSSPILWSIISTESCLCVHQVALLVYSHQTMTASADSKIKHPLASKHSLNVFYYNSISRFMCHQIIMYLYDFSQSQLSDVILIVGRVHIMTTQRC